MNFDQWVTKHPEIDREKLALVLLSSLNPSIFSVEWNEETWDISMKRYVEITKPLGGNNEKNSSN